MLAARSLARMQFFQVLLFLSLLLSVTSRSLSYSSFLLCALRYVPVLFQVCGSPALIRVI
jgi:hypothetical protein